MGDSAPSVSSGPRLYGELAEWYPLVTPVSDYAEEAAFYRRLTHCHKPPRTLTDSAYLLRDESDTVEVIHDRHVMGLFPRAVWLELIAEAGFEPLAVPFEHSSYVDAGHEVFLGLRPEEEASHG